MSLSRRWNLFRMAHFCTAILLLVVSLSGPVQAKGEKFGVEKPSERSTKRFALVMGVGNYDNNKMDLERTPADAKAMARTFAGMGFTVVGPNKRDGDPWLNPTRGEMAGALEELAMRVERYIADNDGRLRPQVAIYYSGHGMEADGENYLLPKDVKIISNARHVMDGNALSLSSMLTRLRKAGPHLTLVILDACRTLPGTGWKSPTSAVLANPSAQQGEFVMYAARGKESALEFIDNSKSDKSPYSVYTRFLLQEMERRQSLLNMALNVRKKVKLATGGDQVPAHYDEYLGSDELVLATGESVPPTGEPGGDEGSSGGDTLVVRAEIAFWESASKQGCSGYRRYLTRYPNGQFSELAQEGVAQCETKKEPPPPAGRAVGEVFRDCAACPEMVVLPAGSFEMGDLHGDGEPDEKRVRTVRIGASFAMGKYEVTQGQWRAVMGSNPSYFSNCGDSCPVEQVSREDVQVFLRKLSGKTGKLYRLPSEAEWEYACRAGGRHKYCGSDIVDAVSWYDENSSGKTHAVGGKGANGWGLHDMSGNVWEWVQDCYEESYDKGQPSDGRAHEPSTNCARRVNRGGGCYDDSRVTRSAIRDWNSPDDRNFLLGFRLSRTLP